MADGDKTTAGNEIPEIMEELRSIGSCLILCHTDTDGDALGAALALKRQMRALGKGADMAVDSAIPECLLFLEEMQDALHEIPDKHYDAVIAVDTWRPEALGRLSESFAAFASHGGKTLNIDHHAYNTGYGTVRCTVPCCACCELLADIFMSAGWEPDAGTANLLMLGLLTDSGMLAHADATAKSRRIASWLMAHGADPYALHERICRQSADRIQALHRKVAATRKEFFGGRLAVCTVSNAEIAASGLDRSATEGILEEMLAEPGVEVAALIKEQEGGGWFKAFLRSKSADAGMDIGLDIGADAGLDIGLDIGNDIGVDVGKAAQRLGGTGGPSDAVCMMQGTAEKCTAEVVHAVCKIL